MHIPYTYIIKCIPENKVYYGVRFAKNCTPEDLWVTYFTSSKLIKNKLKEYGKNAFITEIRKIFKNVESARNWENRVLRRLKVVKRTEFYNKTDNKAIAPLFEKDNPASRKDVKNKISEKLKITALKGNDHPRRKSPEKYTHIGNLLRGRNNTWSEGDKNPMHRPDVKEKFKNLRGIHKNIGRIQTLEEKEKRRLSNTGKVRIKYNCIHCGKSAAKNMILKWHNDHCKFKRN